MFDVFQTPDRSGRKHGDRLREVRFRTELMNTLSTDSKELRNFVRSAEIAF